MTTSNNKHNQRKLIREAYGQIAQSGGFCRGGSSCCGTSQPHDIASTIGYSSEELANVPEAANMGLSCGNPTAIASLREGETVLDLGCGGGFDLFIAARKVGSTGHVIGVDMTPDMIDRARTNTQSFTNETGLDNVDIRLGEIEHLPVSDSTVDVVISNCVINLSDDKPQLWREIARVLKPGGRACISDIAIIQPLPDSVKTSIQALVGCVAGAVLIEETEQMILKAGLTITSIEKHREYIESMKDMQDPLYQQIVGLLPEISRISDYVTSLSLITQKKS